MDIDDVVELEKRVTADAISEGMREERHKTVGTAIGAITGIFGGYALSGLIAFSQPELYTDISRFYNFLNQGTVMTGSIIVGGIVGKNLGWMYNHYTRNREENK